MFLNRRVEAAAKDANLPNFGSQNCGASAAATQTLRTTTTTATTSGRQWAVAEIDRFCPTIAAGLRTWAVIELIDDDDDRGPLTCFGA